ncbi:hypothetical protein, partial [Escherichia coli]|uniref:hypothetical protein n=1 Tax=Escherichia coli TaxID=562 RepID=UPI00215ACE9F
VAEAVADLAGEIAVICCMAWFLFRWLNNACSVEIQRGTDKELNQELAGKSQFLVAPGLRLAAADMRDWRHKQKRRTTRIRVARRQCGAGVG